VTSHPAAEPGQLSRPGPAISEDGRFWWDGFRWQPFMPPAPMVPMLDPVLAAQRKNPWLHLLASFFIPGLGSLLAGHRRRGGIILGVWALGLVLYFVAFFAIFNSVASNLPSTNDINNFNNAFTGTSNAFHAFSSLFIFVPIFMIIELGIWVFGLIDAYQAAEKWNREHGILW